MRELREKEISAIAGGYRAGVPTGALQMFRPGGPVNPLAVTFGTPIASGFALPASAGAVVYWPNGIF